MATNQPYLGTNRTNLFHYQTFFLSQIVVYRNGQPIDGTPVSTTFNHPIYFNTLETLYFLDKGGHGITLDNFIMAFDLTSTQEASHGFIQPELTNCSISVQLTFVGKMYSFEILLLWSFCCGQFPKANKRRIYYS